MVHASVWSTRGDKVRLATATNVTHPVGGVETGLFYCWPEVSTKNQPCGQDDVQA